MIERALLAELWKDELFWIDSDTENGGADVSAWDTEFTKKTTCARTGLDVNNKEKTWVMKSLHLKDGLCVSEDALSS